MKKKQADRIIKLAEDHGSPLYVYDGSIIEKQIRKLKNAFGDINLKIHYACKANSNKQVLEHMRGNGIGIDTVSPEEYDYCLDIGFEPKDILFTPSFPDVDDLLTAMKKSISVHIGSMEYLPLIAKDINKPIGLRINPETPLEGELKVSTGHIDSKFGIPISKIDELLLLINKYGIKINALHVHPGSDISDWKQMADAVAKIFDLVPLFPDLEYIDIGSGFKVQFNPEEPKFDINSYAQYIQKRTNELDENIEIKIEPGKFLVSEAGVFITKVSLVKQGVTTKFVGLNSGFNHLIRPMYYGAYHEIINLSNTDGMLEPYDIVGYLCEEDTFAYKRSLPKIKRGDFLMFKNAGAYGFTMASDYNLRQKPKELFVETI